MIEIYNNRSGDYSPYQGIECINCTAQTLNDKNTKLIKDYNEHEDCIAKW